MPGLPDLRGIRVFLVLCEELSFARTAERAQLTPSRVSQTVRALEAAVGGKLFERSSRRVTMTPLGERLRHELGPAYEQMQRGWAATQEAGSGVIGSLRLGMYHPGLAGPHISAIIAAFEVAYPASRVESVETGWDALGALRRGDVEMLAQRLPLSDAAFTVGPIISQEDRVAAVCVDHPLARHAAIRYDDLGEYTVTDQDSMPREMLDAFIPPVTPNGRTLRRMITGSTPETIVRIVTGELVHPTVASFTVFAAHPKIVAVPISDLPPSQTALVWRAGEETLAIRALAREAARIMSAESSRRAAS